MNQTYGGEGSSGYSAPRTEEWNRKISESNKGKNFLEESIKRRAEKLKGKHLSESHKKKISLSLSNRIRTEEHKRNLSKALKGRKLTEEQKAIHMKYLRPDPGEFYEIITPEGEKIVIRNLAKFCRENNLSKQNLGQVALGKRKSHKSYKAHFLDQTYN